MKLSYQGNSSRRNESRHKLGFGSARWVLALGVVYAGCAASAATSNPTGVWGANAPARKQAISSLKTAVASPTGETARIATSKEDGTVIFLSAPPSSPIPLSKVRGALPAADVAREFVKEHGTLFHEDDARLGFTVAREKSDAKRTYIRLNQTYGGVPVFGANSTVQVSNTFQGVEAVSSDIMGVPSKVDADDLKLAPTLTADEAKQQVLSEWQNKHPNVALKASAGELMVYCPSVVGAKGAAQLVWKFEVSGVQGGLVGDMVLWNAHSGTQAFTYPLLHNAMVREIYDANGADSQGTLVLSESLSSSNIQDAKFAYGFFKNTYDFYFQHHGRDSIDDQGLTISATVRYCPGGVCPFANAFWDSLEQRMYFGAGYASADDVVGHELTHGVTSAESDLIYFAESGAINESFSDMWGEWIDQTNGLGNDNHGDPANGGVKWLMGEDLPVGAIRSMKDPTLFAHADRLGSPYYISDEYDQAGVHLNSGIGNKLAYLLTDGGTFNGKTISGFGIPKTAKLFYEVQSNLLADSNNYQDLYFLLLQAAVNLGYTGPDIANIDQACQAVEIHLPGPVPINDNFTNALDLQYSVNTPPVSGLTVTGTGSTSGTNSRATLELNENVFVESQSFGSSTTLVSTAENSVWWNFRALGDGPVIIDTIGSSFDTVLVVYKGDSLDNLTTVTMSNDVTPVNFASRVTFSVKANEVYRIAVTGAIEKLIFDLGEEEEEEEEVGNNIVLEFLVYSRSSGMVKLNVKAPVLMPPHNDNFGNASLLPFLSGMATSFNFSATQQPGETLHAGVAGGRSVWWKYVAYESGKLELNTKGSNFDTVLAVYTGSLGALNEIGSNNDISLIDEASSLTVSVNKGTTYYIAIDGNNGAFGNANLNYSGPIPPPPGNDNFSQAIGLANASGSVAGVNVSATKEAEEPSHADVEGGRSAWWKYNAKGNGIVTIDTNGSNFNTVLAVYTLPQSGNGVDVVIPVTSNNDTVIGGNWSRVTFEATKDTTYYIAVDGFYGASGGVVLNYSGPTGSGGGGGGGTEGADLLPENGYFKVKKGKLQGSLTVENIGIGISAKTSADVYVSPTAQLSGATFLKSLKVAGLKPGKVKKLKVKAKESVSLSGKYIVVVVDPLELVTEQSETNNTLIYGPLP